MKNCVCAVVAMLVVVFAAGQAQAVTHVNESGSADREQRMDRSFRVGGQTELKLTIGCQSNSNGRGHLRVYFYQRSPQGGWDQITDLRILLTANQDRTSDTFTLPPGQYMMTISARRMDYLVLLEDNEE